MTAISLDEQRLHRTLARLPSLAGEPRTVERLEGGLTNVNFKVTTPQRTAVVRLSSVETDLLAIDRAAEEVNSRRAAASGAAPAVLDYLPDQHALVVEWVKGVTLQPADLADETTLVRAATVCRLLHSGPRFVGEFDMFEVQRRYLTVVRERGFRLPPRYLDLGLEADRVAEALAVRRGPTVPCNNDLLAANFIDDGERLWLIDYEYAGNNDPCFELGNIWSESNLSLDHLELLVESYYGAHLRHKVARARLLGLIARYGWTLWASIQDAVSPIDFDFWSWGMEKYVRAVEEFDGPDFERLLDEARRPD
ncbi:MAG: choline kinase family protein [Spirochaetaceae bacterium]|nr:choline kinase family protein [Spirochaetaceae bacterium]